MTNEEFQKLVLEKLTSLEQGQAKLEQGQANLEQRQANLEQGQKILETKVDNGQSNLATRLENVEGQLMETNGILKALMHNTEELNAKYDGLLNITASKESIDRLETKIDILTHRVLAQDGEIQLLKKAK